MAINWTEEYRHYRTCSRYFLFIFFSLPVRFRFLFIYFFLLLLLLTLFTLINCHFTVWLVPFTVGHKYWLPFTAFNVFACYHLYYERVNDEAISISGVPETSSQDESFALSLSNFHIMTTVLFLPVGPSLPCLARARVPHKPNDPNCESTDVANIFGWMISTTIVNLYASIQPTHVEMSFCAYVGHCFGL